MPACKPAAGFCHRKHPISTNDQASCGHKRESIVTALPELPATFGIMRAPCGPQGDCTARAFGKLWHVAARRLHCPSFRQARASCGHHDARKPPCFGSAGIMRSPFQSNENNQNPSDLWLQQPSALGRRSVVVVFGLHSLHHPRRAGILPLRGRKAASIKHTLTSQVASDD